MIKWLLWYIYYCMCGAPHWESAVVYMGFSPVGCIDYKKGKEKVCWCVKADKVWSNVATLLNQMVDLSKFIRRIPGSVAVQYGRHCTKILPSIRSLLIRLVRPSSSFYIWISGWTKAGVTRAPRLLRAPSTACQYAWNTADQCLLNHSQIG